ncbi:PREDICTED: RRP15-like protein [Priapulus caudatus]|uniref:RRP15-like protein n=1 Tax=Priapulus caudatus TaxID=37621 RepID=A0ABM1EVJ0_PRICU|nr:PREDICTED: RRP15-like protein [Priapulus caudatus]
MAASIDTRYESSSDESLGSGEDSHTDDEDVSCDDTANKQKANDNVPESQEQNEELAEAHTHGMEKTGMADVMERILSRSAGAAQSAILSKAPSRDKKLKKTEEADSLSTAAKRDAEEPDSGVPSKAKRKEKAEWDDYGHVKPKVTDKEKEKNLARTATRGVVQLFNAVRQQQKRIEDEMKVAGSSIRKQDKVMKSLTKGRFLDMLKGGAEKERPTVQIKEDSNETKPAWNALREDFMLGAKMKDWDKDSGNDSDEQPI